MTTVKILLITVCMCVFMPMQIFAAAQVIVFDALGRLEDKNGVFNQLNKEYLKRNEQVKKIDEWSDLGYSSIHRIARMCDPENLQDLLNEKADVNIIDVYRTTPLMHAAGAEENSSVCVQKLLEAGAEVGASSYEGKTALQFAKMAGNEEAAALLTKAGEIDSAPSVPVSDGKGQTQPKHKVHIRLEMGEEEIVMGVLKSDNPDLTADKSLSVSLLLERPQAKLVELAKTLPLDVDTLLKDKPPLAMAVRFGNKEIVTLLLARKANPNVVVDDKIPVLFQAMLYMDDMVAAFVEAGANPTATDSNGWNALHFVARYGKIALIPFFTSRGVDINGLDKEGLPPLVFSADKETFKALVAAGANARGKRGQRDLLSELRQSLRDDPEIKRLAIGVGLADPKRQLAEALVNNDKLLFNTALSAIPSLPKRMKWNSSDQDSDSFTPLQLALWHGDPEITLALIKAGADPNSSMCKPGVRFIDMRGNVVKCSEDILLSAIEKKYYAMALVLIENGVGVNNVENHPELDYPIHFAAYRESIDVMRALLAHRKIKVDQQNRSGRTALYIAAEKNNTELIRMLLAAKADPNKKAGEYTYFKTPFMVMVDAGNSEAVKLALAAGAKYQTPTGRMSDTQQGEVQSAITVAALSGNYELVKLFADKGVSLTTTNKLGRSLLHLAAKKGAVDLLDFLVTAGLDIHAKDEYQETPMHVAVQENNIVAMQYFVSKGMSVTRKGTYDKSLLCVAADSGSLEAVSWLLDQGCPVDEVNGASGKQFTEGTLNTPLFYAADYNGGRKNPIMLEIAKVLISKGANVNGVNRSGKTPLHAASQTRFSSMVELLLNHGANVSACTINGWTPLFRAGSIETMDMLLAAGVDINAVDSEGKTALDNTSPPFQEHIAYLLSKGGKRGEEISPRE